MILKPPGFAEAAHGMFFGVVWESAIHMFSPCESLRIWRSRCYFGQRFPASRSIGEIAPIVFHELVRFLIVFDLRPI